MSNNKLALSHRQNIRRCLRTGVCTYAGRQWTLLEYLKKYFFQIFNLLLSDNEQRSLLRDIQCPSAKGRQRLTPEEVLSVFGDLAKDEQGRDVLHHEHPLHFSHTKCKECWAEQLEQFFLDSSDSRQVHTTEQLREAV